MSDPNLSDERREKLVHDLMDARRAVAEARREGRSEKSAHERVDAAKQALGERGPVWWDDGAPDVNRHLAKNTPYAEWASALK